MTAALTVQRGGALKNLDDAVKADLWYAAKQMIAGGLFPSKFKTPESAFAAALYGRELGLTPQRAWKVIHLIEGMPCLEVHQQVTMAREAIPGLVWGITDHTDEGCTIEHGRPGGKVYTTTFTYKEAQAAGLSEKGVWKKHRRNMLYARAATNAIKWYYPETQGGLVHSLEELRDVVEGAGARETGAERSVKAQAVEADFTTAPDVEAPKVEDPAAVEALRVALAACRDKNEADREHGKFRTANTGKPHTLLAGYELAGARLHQIANPTEAATAPANN